MTLDAVMSSLSGASVAGDASANSHKRSRVEANLIQTFTKDAIWIQKEKRQCRRTPVYQTDRRPQQEHPDQDHNGTAGLGESI